MLLGNEMLEVQDWLLRSEGAARMLREGGELRNTLGEHQAQGGEQTKDQVTRKREHGTFRGWAMLCACSDALSKSKTKQTHSNVFS